MADETVLPPTKICTRCSAENPATAEFFYRDRTLSGGFSSRCKACLREIRAMPISLERARLRKRRYLNSPRGKETSRLYSRRYALANAGKISENQRAYRRANPEKFKHYERQRIERHREKRRAALRAAYAKNSVKARARSAEWRRQNREAHLARRRARTAELKAADPHFRVLKAISGSLLQALRNRKNGARWEWLVGFSRDHLIRHLEQQFLPGMRWENFGKLWHIDHIVPVSAFKFASAHDPEVRACWALSNLRPLWKRDNLSKHAKRTHLI